VTSTGDEFLTVAEIAGILKLNQQTVRNWIEAEPCRHSTSTGGAGAAL
jgi:hypothetical protein